MSNPSKRIEYQVPLHYHQYAPNFIIFLERFYDWLYRSSGLTKLEVESIGTKLAANQNQILNPGASADLLPDFILMEEIREEFLTADEDFFCDSSDAFIETHKIDEEIIEKWFSLFGTKRPDQATDPVLMLSILKHINAIKGTEKSIQLFFNLFFGEDVEVYYPKFDIAIIDESFTPDVVGIIRDDYYYNEYSYVIRVTSDINKYTDLFEKVYLKNIHPAGFKVFLEKN